MIVRLLTWNVLHGAEHPDVLDDWPERRLCLFHHLRSEAPDVFCAQEVLAGQLADIGAVLRSHTVVAAGRDGDGLGEHCPIFFRTDRFLNKASGTFWFNDFQDRPGKSWGTAYNRICTWTELLDKKSGSSFLIWNTHLPLEPPIRLRAISLLCAHSASCGALPQLLVGDFNEPQGATAWPQLAEAGFYDTALAASPAAVRPTFQLPTGGDARIDWVLATDQWQVRDFRTLGDFTSIPRASDHNGVVVTLALD